MKNLKKLASETDDSILSEIISACESKMSSPFNKKKEEAVIVAEVEPEAEETEEPVDEVLADSEEKPEDEMSEEDLEKLKELYAKISK